LLQGAGARAMETMQAVFDSACVMAVLLYLAPA
jgi:hypothetical protein